MMQSLRATALAAVLAVAAPCLCGGEADPVAEMSARILSRPDLAAREKMLPELAVACLLSGRLTEGLDTFVRLFAKAIRSEDDLPSESEADVLLRATDPFVLLATLNQARIETPPEADTLRWLYGSEARQRHFLDILSPQDDLAQVQRLVSELCRHDPEGRDTFRELILALALVWDQPRPKPHPQMGGEALPYAEAVTERYDYFKDLFVSRRAEIPYARLSVAALMAVVDTPVPVSELRWVRDNERPTNWERKFHEIRYDEDRLQRAVYDWPHGPYTLEAVHEKGGICVDQAYYATLCARAYGVPALLFVGEGRRGHHAWYGYMKGLEKWEMDIGRYAYDKYATGFAVNPQTNLPMTDHDVSFLCDRALRGDAYGEAAGLARFAHVLQQLGYRAAARRQARRSIDAAPLYEFPWRILEGMLEKEEDWRGLAALLDTEAGVFRKYPDFTARIRARQAEALRRAGDHEGAERILKSGTRRVGQDRDDLQRALVSERVKAAYDQGDYPGARRHFEDLLKDQKEEGQKLMQLLDSYLDLTRETRQTGEAVRFLKRYIDSLERRYGGSDRNRALLWGILLKAYENDGDDAEAARLRKRIEKRSD
ncbi:MAG: hypothetical protein JXR77_13550 [Lentisphaeria bacterium]|nr:hypothetical protein [Lentisphaeria bacterium]